MENWDDLRFVVALARYGSMANAARHLRTNTATVSRRIKRLNETANTTLFHKGANEWEMTAEGRRLYEIAAHLSDELDTFKIASHDNEQVVQTVRVTGLEFLNSEVLSKNISTLRKNHPNISLELAASDNNVSLAYGEADIALRLSRPREGRLVARRNADVKIGVYGTPNQERGDWIGLPYELDWTPEMKYGEAFFGRPPSLRLSSFSAILEAMSQTGLPGIAPEFMASNAPQFELMHSKAEQTTREVWILVHETRKNDLGIKNTCKWIEESFSKTLNKS